MHRLATRTAAVIFLAIAALVVTAAAETAADEAGVDTPAVQEAEAQGFMCLVPTYVRVEPGSGRYAAATFVAVSCSQPGFGTAGVRGQCRGEYFFRNGTAVYVQNGGGTSRMFCPGGFTAVSTWRR